VQDHTPEIVGLEAECEGLRNRLDEVEASKSVSVTLKNQIALLETRIENERREHERTRRDGEEKMRTQKNKYEHMLHEAQHEPKQIDREVEEIIELQRRLLKHKDEEIRHLSEIAAAHKEQLALLQCFLKDGLDDVGRDILHVNKHTTVELLGGMDAHGETLRE
jgi:predicted  nucleic acid-binding Zn-ribbon protein